MMKIPTTPNLILIPPIENYNLINMLSKNKAKNQDNLNLISKKKKKNKKNYLDIKKSSK
jgi:hypothetical protein